ncbi:hypothetical protein LguiA_030024 [Lonicera macranthoides]
MKINFWLLVSYLTFFMLSWVVLYAQPVAYDHIQMVHTWIPTYCKDRNNACSRRVTNFNLHGLWPANARGYVLGPCLTTPPDLDDVYRALRLNLGNYWPSLTSRWTNKRFWDHEWTAHGSCSSNVLPPLQYFTAAITQGSRTDITRWLRVARPRPIQPSDSALFRQSDIENAIKAVIGVNLNIYVSCRQFRGDVRYYLYEIHICLDTTATNYVSCPASTSLRGCPANKDDALIKYITISSASIVDEESPNELIQSS